MCVCVCVCVCQLDYCKIGLSGWTDYHLCLGSEFQELHDILCQLKVDLPSFPAKIYMGRSHIKQVTCTATLLCALTFDKEATCDYKLILVKFSRFFFFFLMNHTFTLAARSQRSEWWLWIAICMSCWCWRRQCQSLMHCTRSCTPRAGTTTTQLSE